MSSDESEVDVTEEGDESQDQDNEDEFNEDAGSGEEDHDEPYEIDLGEGDIEEDGSDTPKDRLDQDQTNEEKEDGEPEHEMSVLETEIARVLDVGCTEVQRKLTDHLETQKKRLTECEQRVHLALKQCGELLEKHEQMLVQNKLERENIQAKVELLEENLRCEREERAEEREWITGLWPDNVPLPTLLVPIKKAIEARCSGVAVVEPVKFVKDVADDQERKRLEALVTRRVEREHVRRQLEEALQWKLMLPETPEDGEDPMSYYVNSSTGESVWDAPVVMLFEAPLGWNMVAMDWEEDFGLENFYPEATKQARHPNIKIDNDEAESGDENSIMEKKHDDSGKLEASEDEEDDDDDLPMDPMPARERFEAEMKRYDQLKAEVEESAAKQRSFAMEVMTAQRELFEREQEILKEEDAGVIAVERKRRIAEKEEQAAAKAKAEAQQRKAQQASSSKTSVPVFARDSVAKKGLTLAADDQVFEQELRDFALAQRVDRLYLSTPLSRDPRVRDRHRLDPEYVHMKHVESRLLETDKLEFDLLEKSSLRHEEAAAKVTELRDLCERIREQQKSIEEKLVTVETSIAKLEAAATPPPEQPRPTEEELERAAGRFLTVDPPPHDEEDENEIDVNVKAGSAAPEDTGAVAVEIESSYASEQVAPSSAAVPDPDNIASVTTTCAEAHVDDARMKMDEFELRELKAFTDAELVWRQWDKAEKVRNMKLNILSDRHKILTTSQKQLAVDLALYGDADAPFFERLSDLEKTANTRMWDLQAQTQVVRARFLVERAAREESVFQLRDRLKELQQQLDDAYALPLQATHPLERIELEAQSKELVESLKKQEAELQARYTKEEEAKALLVSLELRSCDYADAKLQEETKLFAEKQALWDLNFTLVDELESCRQTIERLYLLMQQEKGTDDNPEEDNTEEGQDPRDNCQATVEGDDAGEDAEPSSRELYEENARVFETRLEYLQQVRRFLLMCYDREDRWRALAASTLIKDTTSDEWMTSMQLSRQEDTLALLQTQHEKQQQVLQRQIKLLTKAKAALQVQIDEANRKMHRLQSDYQAASESVRLQTQDVIKTLRSEVEEHKAVLEKEKLKFRSDREQLIREHNTIREELEKRLQELDDVLDKQTHWLTAAKRELHAQRVANEELLKAYQSLEKRRAAEVNDMCFRISAQIRKINNIEMWNLSMKISAKEAHTDFINMQKDMTQQRQQHKQLQRGLRLMNWRHRVTAQTILTDVNMLFSFFADGIEILAGATPEINDALRENAGIEVLAAIARYSTQQSVRAICARALGQMAWNANVTARSLGWKAKQKWFQWMKAQSDAVLEKLSVSKMSFDAVAEEEATEMNWLADPSSPIDDISGESDHDLSSKGGKQKEKKLLFTRTWQQFDEKTFPDTNEANQEYMGLSSNVLQTILDLCRSPETDKLVKRNALHSLALIVRNTRNTSIVGRLDGSIALLVNLLEPKSDMDREEDPQVVRHAVQALANLAFRNDFNQQTIFTEGGIPLLLHLCDRAVNSSDALDADVDLTLATTQALSHLSHDHVQSCQAIVESRGISILTKLCNSRRIHDAIDLNVCELIQTYASQVIANVTTLLDKEESESDHRSYRIADFILEEQTQPPSIVTQRELDHDNQQQHKDKQRVQRPQKHAGVATFVLMCASCNRNVAFHGAVVLGSIAQHDAIRGAIGAASGMDALFLLAARLDDLPMVAQATWALANLTWNRDNQYRVARYIDHLYQLCTLTSSQPTQSSLNQLETNQQDEEDQDDEKQDPASRLQRIQQDEQLTRQIREYALCILANSLFYNDANRQLVASHTHWMQLFARNALNADGSTLENSARALCSLSYSDSIALQMGSTTLIEVPSKAGASTNGKGTTPMNGLHLFIRLCGRTGQVAVQQHGLFGVINMCLHDSNKTRMLEIPHGIDTLVNLSGHMNKDLCGPALEALELLADMRQLKQDHGISSGQSFESVDMKKLIVLLSESTNPSLVAMISDAIADEVWKRPSAQVRLRNEHGLEKLLEICVKQSPVFPSATSGSSPAASAEIECRVRISCLWALRNTVANNVRNQDLVGALGGVQQLVSLFDRERQSEEVVEALLAALVAVVMKNARNSQQLVQFGLDMLIGLADGSEDGDRLEEDRRTKDRGVTLPPLKSPTHAMTAFPSKLDSGDFKLIANAGEKQLENAALARELLHLVAPYNSRENTAAAPLSPDAKLRRMQQLQTSSASPVHRR